MAVYGFVIFALCLASCVFATNFDGLGDFAASRHLLSTADDKSYDGAKYENNCSLVYSRKITVFHISGGMKTPIHTLPAMNSTTGTCFGGKVGAPGYSYINVDYKNMAGVITDLSMKITFNSTAGGAWSMTEMLVTFKCAAKTKDNCTSITNERMDVSFITSYLGFSYHCYQPPQIIGANATMGLSFDKLQVQGFGVKGGKFSAADDCVGFFTGGVWSSLFIALLLTIILLYGIGMISSINSMDRFDDPRGPGIQINAAE